MNKKFPLRTVLTVTTGRLLTKPRENNGIGDLYEILEHMTGQSPFTHALPRFAAECKPKLLKWFPALANADLDSLDVLIKQPGGVDIWLEKCVTEWGMSPLFSLASNSVNTVEQKDPVAELQTMVDDG